MDSYHLHHVGRGTNWFSLNYILSALAWGSPLIHIPLLLSLNVFVLWRSSLLPKKVHHLPASSEEHHLHEADQEGTFTWPHDNSNGSTSSVNEMGNEDREKGIAWKSGGPVDNDTSRQEVSHVPRVEHSVNVLCALHPSFTTFAAFCCLSASLLTTPLGAQLMIPDLFEGVMLPQLFNFITLLSSKLLCDTLGLSEN